MKNFKDYLVWEKAHLLVKEVYIVTRSFPETKRFNLISQLRRASTSIPTNIAEGTGKFTQKDFLKYLQQALGSTHEVEYLLLLSFELQYIGDDTYKNSNLLVNEVKAMLISLIKKIKNEIK